MARKVSRSRTVHRFPTNEFNKFIEIRVSYCEGGTSYFSGVTNARAYYMHVTPVEIENYDGAEIKTFMMFSGLKSKLEEVKRFSEKKLNELAEKIRQDCEARDGVMMSTVNRVLFEENLQLQEAVAV